MGYVEIFRLDEQGAGWVDLSEATPDELLTLELGLFQEGALWGISHPQCPKCPNLDLIMSAKSVKLTV